MGGIRQPTSGATGSIRVGGKAVGWIYRATSTASTEYLTCAVEFPVKKGDIISFDQCHAYDLAIYGIR